MILSIRNTSLLFGCCLLGFWSVNAHAERFIKPKNLVSFGPVPDNLQDRYINCPVQDVSHPQRVINGKRYLYKNSQEIAYQQPKWQTRTSHDWHALDKLIPLQRGTKDYYDEDNGVWILVIDILRVNGVPHYLYLANHERQNIPFEPWSSVKLFSAAAAISKARKSSGGNVGGDAKIGVHAVGDIITVATAYRHTGTVRSSSNHVSNFMLRSASEQYAEELIQNWINPGDTSGFHGKFSHKVFDPQTTVWRSPKGSVSLPFTHYSDKDAKAMSLLTTAEWMKRLAMHEADKNTRMPHLQAIDIETIFYGNAKTSPLGGAHKATSVYISKALTQTKPGHRSNPFSKNNQAAKQKLNDMTNGNWRIFKKNGAGPSLLRKRSEITLVSYTCLPNIQGTGREFILAARSSLKNPGCKTSQSCYARLHEADQQLTKATNHVVNLLMQANANEKTPANPAP